jgi:hypothetical protein
VFVTGVDGTATKPPAYTAPAASPANGDGNMTRVAKNVGEDPPTLYGGMTLTE